MSVLPGVLFTSEGLVQEVDSTSNMNNSGCPTWCVEAHPADEHPEDGWHRSRTSSPPVIGWFARTQAGSGAEPTAATVHVALVQPRRGGEPRLRLESDELGALDLDPSSALRVASVVSGLLEETR